MIIWQRSFHEVILNNAAMKLWGLTDRSAFDALIKAGHADPTHASFDKGIFSETALMAAVAKMRPYLVTPELIQRGMGEMHCRRLAELGASVWLADLDAGSGSQAAEAIASAGLACTFGSLDVTQETAWEQVLDKMQMKGTGTGKHAAESVEQLTTQAQETLRRGREVSVKAVGALLDSYAALASGVLIGMSQGLQAGSAEPASSSKKKAR